MRFANEGTRAGRRSAGGEKKTRKDEPVTKYFTSQVNAVSDRTPAPEVIEKLINSEHNSIVLTNTSKKPTGFLSTRDILLALTLLAPQAEVPLNMRRPGDSVSDEQLEKATEYLEQFAIKLKKRMKIDKIEVTSQEPKNTVGDTKLYNVTLIVTPLAGRSLVATAKRENFLDAIQEAASLIEKQRRRAGLTREETVHS